jgi:hypothetical protein
MVRLRDHGLISPAELKRLHAVFESMGILEQMVHWASRAEPPGAVVDVVVQDEFSHDVVLRWAHVHLVFDTNCMGGIYGADAWDHRPTADELLAARLRAGWKPIPTKTQDGEESMGHASCLSVKPAAR